MKNRQLLDFSAIRHLLSVICPLACYASCCALRVVRMTCLFFMQPDLPSGIQKYTENLSSTIFVLAKKMSSITKSPYRHSLLDVSIRFKASRLPRATTTILDDLELGIILLDEKDEIVYINQAVMDIFSLEKEDMHIIQKNPFKFLAPLGHVFENFKKSSIPQQFESIPVYMNKKRQKQVSGFIRPVYIDNVLQGTLCTFLELSALLDSKDLLVDFFLNLEKVVAQKTKNLVTQNTKLQREVKKHLQQEKELKNLVKMFQNIFQKLNYGLCTFTPDGMLLEANPSMATMLGFSSPQALKEAVNNNGWQMFQDSALWNLVAQQVMKRKKIIRLEVQTNLKKKTTSWAEISAFSYNTRHGQILLAMVFTDISKRKASELELYNQATIDSLTNIPNRSLWRDRLEQAIKKARRYKESFAVIYLDLDGFKEINDHLGHECGDQVLITVSRRMQKKIRESDTLARIGGDEFCILVNNVQKSQLPQMAKSLIETITRPIQLEKTQKEVGVSIGICMFDASGLTSSEIMNRADKAMYMAKTQGGNRYVIHANGISDKKNQPQDPEQST